MSPSVGDPVHIYQDDEGKDIGVCPGTPTVGDASTLDDDHGSNNAVPAIGDPVVISQDDQGVWIGRDGKGTSAGLWYCNRVSADTTPGTPELVAQGGFTWCKIVVDHLNQPWIIAIQNYGSDSYVFIFRRTNYGGNPSPWEKVYHVWVHDGTLTCDAIWVTGIPSGWYHPGITSGLLILYASNGGHWDPLPMTTFYMMQCTSYGSSVTYEYPATNILLAPSGHRFMDANRTARPVLMGTWPTFHFVIQSMIPSENLGYTFNYAKINLNTQVKAVYQNTVGQYFGYGYGGITNAILKNGVPLIVSPEDRDPDSTYISNMVRPRFILWNGTSWTTSPFYWDLSDHPPDIPAGLWSQIGDWNCYFYGTPWEISPWFFINKFGKVGMITPLRYARGRIDRVPGLLLKIEGLASPGSTYDPWYMTTTGISDGNDLKTIDVKERVTGSATHWYEVLYRNGGALWAVAYIQIYDTGQSGWGYTHRQIEPTKVLWASMNNQGAYYSQAAYIKSA